MSPEKRAVSEDLQQLSQRVEAWRSAHPPRSRLPESMWAAAAEMARRHGLHCTAKTLRLDYTRLKKHLGNGQISPSAPTRFLEFLTPPVNQPGECVVEVESSCGRMRVAMKGVTPDWPALLRAWREVAG